MIGKATDSSLEGASDILDKLADSLEKNDEKIMSSLGKITQRLGKLQGNYDISYQIGKTKGFW